MTRFWHLDREPMGPRAFCIAWILATVSAQAGLAWGSWMARVKR